MGWFDENCGDPSDNEKGSSTSNACKSANGHFEKGTRKCSKCKSYKTIKDFNKEEAKKSASRRICNECGPPMPQYFNAFTIEQLKKQLMKRGEEKLSGKKADLVDRLKGLVEKEANENSHKNTVGKPSTCIDGDSKQSDERSTMSYDVIMSLKVIDLRKALKARGLPVSGLKAVLQERLLHAEGISKEVAEKQTLAMLGTKMQSLTVDDKEAPNVKDTKKQMEKTEAKEAINEKPPVGFTVRNCEAEPLVAHPCIVEKENQKSNMEFSSDAYDVKTTANWRKVAPPDDKESKLVNNRTFFWCGKCKRWTGSHTTKEHKGKKKKRNNKKPIPLAPFALSVSSRTIL